jgi:hypothetical protein
MKSWRNVAIAATALCVSGCGAMPLRRASVSSASVPRGAGIVLVSVTSLDSHCMVAASDLAIRAANTGKMVSWLFVQNPFTKSDFTGYLGHVYALTLPAGEYAFWIKQSNRFFGYEDPHVGKGFHVVSGQTEYLGDFWIRGCGNIQAGFRNRWPEVKAKFAAVYPSLDLNSVRIDVIRSSTKHGD